MLHHSPLGRETQYKTQYAPELLFPIPRRAGRDAIGLPEPLPFRGVDVWTGYELSWLTAKGKPEVAVAEFMIPAATRCLVESKSLKLYLNSFNGTRFATTAEVEERIRRDIARAAEGTVSVRLFERAAFKATTAELEGECVDDIDVAIETYDVTPSLLSATGPRLTETLRSDLLKSNCPVTGQPDWASVMICYTGPQIDRAGLLKYIVSFRNHTGFHEQCVEKMYLDIKARCGAERLTVYARYTRRGGLDINPFRSDFEDCPPNQRTFRQ
jgi:7-cyano-7-deazaguanine reductase